MSPCFIRILRPDGLHPVDYTAESLNDAAQYEPDDGIYTVTNTFEGNKVLKFDAHLDRMEDSARRAAIPLMLDRARLRAALREMIALANFGDVRFRVTVPHAQPDHFILSLEPFQPLSPEFLAQGARVVTAPNSARQNAAAKTTDWMHRRQSIAESLPPGIYDAILLNDAGDLLEGLSSNFYAILGDELRTAGEGVLPGIAQQVVFEIAPALLPVRQEAANIRDLLSIAEAFITSSSRGIVPVVEIDGHRLGDGTPGPRTGALRGRYLAWMQAHLEVL